MERTNRTYLLLLIITTISSYLISQNWEVVLISSFTYMFTILFINLLVCKITEDDKSLINIRKIKYVKHPKSKHYFIYYESDNDRIKLYKSNIFYSEWISTYYIYDDTFDINDLCKTLLNEVNSDIKEYSSTVDDELKKWSGALTKDMERNCEITEILK